ncbi:hypothetical protein ACS0TY_003577 [Phlomoides rotata]
MTNSGDQLIRDGSELSTRDLLKLVQALPQYSEQMERLSIHVEVVSGCLHNIFRLSVKTIPDTELQTGLPASGRWLVL